MLSQLKKNTWGEGKGRIWTYSLGQTGGPCQHPDLRLVASRIDNKFLFFQATQFVILCYGSHKKLILPLKFLILVKKNKQNKTRQTNWLNWKVQQGSEGG